METDGMETDGMETDGMETHGMEIDGHEYGMTDAQRYRVAQANRLVRYCIDQGADIAAVLTREVAFDFTPICGPDGEIVPEAVDLAMAEYDYHVS